MNLKLTGLAVPGKTAVSISTFVFLSGFFTGIFIAVTMQASEKEIVAMHLMSFLSGSDADLSFISYMTSSFRKNALLWLVIFTGGFTVLGAPLSMLPLFYKGAALGLSCTVIIDNMNTSGFKVILLSILPQNMLIVPLFILAASFALAYAHSYFTGKKSGIEKSNLPQKAGPYIIINIIFLAVLLTCAAIEALFVPISL